MNCLPSSSLIVNPSPTQFSTCLAFHFHRHILIFVILLAQLYMCCVLQITRHTFLLKEHLNRLQKIFPSYRILKASFNVSRAMFHYLLDFWIHLDFYIQQKHLSVLAVQYSSVRNPKYVLDLDNGPGGMNLRDSRKNPSFLCVY